MTESTGQTPQPQFENQDNALLWVELDHLKKSNARIEEQLAKINGRVTVNNAWRLTSKERWRTHEKEHDSAKRNGVIVSGILSGAAFIGSIVAQALGIKIQP